MFDRSDITEERIIDEIERLLRKQYNPEALHPRVQK